MNGYGLLCDAQKNFLEAGKTFPKNALASSLKLPVFIF
jgi:hypothetical protein